MAHLSWRTSRRPVASWRDCACRAAPYCRPSPRGRAWARDRGLRPSPWLEPPSSAPEASREMADHAWRAAAPASHRALAWARTGRARRWHAARTPVLLPSEQAQPHRHARSARGECAPNGCPSPGAQHWVTAAPASPRRLTLEPTHQQQQGEHRYEEQQEQPDATAMMKKRASDDNESNPGKQKRSALPCNWRPPAPARRLCREPVMLFAHGRLCSP